MRSAVAFVLAGALLMGQFLPVFAQEIVPAEASLPEAEPVATSTPEAPLLAELVVATTTESAPSVETVSTTEPELDAGPQIIVKFKESALDLERSAGQHASDAFAKDEDVAIEDTVESANIAIVTADASEDAEEVADRLSDNPLVEYAEPNHERHLDSINTNDTLRASLWALENTGQSVNGTTGTADADIDAKEAWDLSVGTSTIVAVIDNGTLYTHDDLVNQMWNGSACLSETGSAMGGCNHGYDYVDNDKSPMPATTTPFPSDGLHGTHVAGIIAAEMNNATGTIGVAPGAKIMAIRFDLDVATEVKAIDFAIQNGAKIINASFGGSSFSQAEYDAIARFRDAGGIFVAAAGNGGIDQIGDNNDLTPNYPASYDLANIVSVAATDQNDVLTTFSNYGTTTVDLAAPGRNILSTATTNGTTTTYAYLSGTSMATPLVAGTLALGRSLYATTSVSTLISKVLSSGDAKAGLASTTASGKRLNAYGFLQSLGIDTTPPVITLTGSASVSLTVGDAYTEQGATALDDQDGSISVTIGGASVNTAAAGTYVVTYDAVDAAGNHAVQVTRTVIVSAAVSSGGGGGGGGGGGSSKSSSSKKSTATKSTTTNVTNPARPLLTTTTTPTVTLPATAPVLFAHDLPLGSSGTDVTALQNQLTRQGFYSGPVTGYLGALTSTALRAFQSAHGLAATGMLDAATRTALNGTAPAVTSTTTDLASKLAPLLALLVQLQARLNALQTGH